MFISYVHFSVKILVCFLMRYMNSEFIMDGKNTSSVLFVANFLLSFVGRKERGLHLVLIVIFFDLQMLHVFFYIKFCKFYFLHILQELLGLGPCSQGNHKGTSFSVYFQVLISLSPLDFSGIFRKDLILFFHKISAMLLYLLWL